MGENAIRILLKTLPPTDYLSEEEYEKERDPCTGLTDHTCSSKQSGPGDLR